MRLLLAVCVLWASPTSAQEAVTDLAAPSEPSPPPETEAAATEDDEAWRLYHAATADMAAGRTTAARAGLEALRERHPDHDAAHRAAALIDALDERERGIGHDLSAPVPEPPAATPADIPYWQAERLLAAEARRVERAAQREERYRNAVRAELVMMQGVHGAGFGANLCALAGCDGGRAWALSILGGASAGLTAAAVATRGGVDPGLAHGLDVGFQWGLWTGASLYLTAVWDENDAGSVRGLLTAMILGHLGGMGAGGLIASTLDPSAGQIGLAYSGGLWATTAMAFALVAEPEGWTRRHWIGLTLAGQLGLVGAGVLASQFPQTTRGRALLVDLGAFFGGGLGVLAGFGIAPDSGGASMFVGGAVGILAGFAGTFALTTYLDIPGTDGADGVSVAVAPQPGGGTANVSVALR